MFQAISEWWHRRTDGVEGIDKIIGAKGSPFRSVVNLAALWAGIVVVFHILVKKEGGS